MKKALLLCPIGIGNYILAYPAFHLLKKQNPECEFYLVALRKSVSDIAKKDSIFKKVLLIDPYNTKGIINKLSWFKTIKKLGCDTAISFFPTNRFEYNALMFASGAKNRYAFKYKIKKITSASFLANKRINAEVKTHDVEQNLRLLSLLTKERDTSVVFPKLFESEDVLEADNWLKENNLNNKKFIGMHSGSSVEQGMSNKRWDTKKFAYLGKKLIDEYNYDILIFGGPEENKDKHGIQKIIGDRAVCVDNLSLSLTSAIISKCKMFVSNDSGLMHISATAKVPTVGIFGPTDDTRTAPWGEKHLIVRDDIECSPCWKINNVGTRPNCKYKDFRCIKDLKVSYVFDKIRKWYKID